MYNFDELIERHGTASYKYDALQKIYGRADLNPLWVADMDFKTPDFIVDALKKRLEHPIFGYNVTGDDYFEIIRSWVKNLHGWDVPKDHFCFVPGIVKGIGLAERCFLDPGDKVIIQPPVYHPFRITTQECGFEVVYNPLLPVYGEDGFLKTYRMDLEGLEKLIDEKVKMLVLCNPHNPCGVTFPAEELRALASICHRHGIIVVSDEIHCEMVLGGRRHVPFATVSKEAEEISITFQSPAKTFNIAGIVTSYSIIFNPELRAKFHKYMDAFELSDPNIFSTISTKAAYKYGREWRNELVEYLEGTVDFVDKWLKENLPVIGCVRPQASFLIWLDCRKLGLCQEALVDLFVNKALLALNDGSVFGKEGTGFMRLNIGCPRSNILKALESLKKAVENL